MICTTCPNACSLKDGEVGLCGARGNVGGIIKSLNYGLTTALALDRIEKKPLRRFCSDTMVLSTGSFGCNLFCSHCQNHTISRATQNTAVTEYISPTQLVEKASQLKSKGNIGIAFTYNEPLIGWEYIADCATLAKQKSLKNVVVTNGYINQKPLRNILPFIDAMNIDLKSYSESFYKRIGGSLQVVKDTILTASKYCHVEVTVLIIPDENDSVEEMENLCRFIASIKSSIPLHISRFFPSYKCINKSPTPINTIEKLFDVAKDYLDFVYKGNCY